MHSRNHRTVHESWAHAGTLWNKLGTKMGPTLGLPSSVFCRHVLQLVTAIYDVFALPCNTQHASLGILTSPHVKSIRYEA